MSELDNIRVEICCVCGGGGVTRTMSKLPKTRTDTWTQIHGQTNVSMEGGVTQTMSKSENVKIFCGWWGVSQTMSKLKFTVGREGVTQCPSCPIPARTHRPRYMGKPIYISVADNQYQGGGVTRTMSELKFALCVCVCVCVCVRVCVCVW